MFTTGYTPLLSLGYKRTIQMEDEFGLPYHLETANTYPSFAARLHKRMEASKETEKVPHARSLICMLPCMLVMYVYWCFTISTGAPAGKAEI
jgi:hypothetical protein